jgi:hypothetical protein
MQFFIVSSECLAQLHLERPLAALLRCLSGAYPVFGIIVHRRRADVALD